MIKSYLISIALLFILSTFGYAQEIKVKFIGNCGLELTDGESTIYMDFPYKSGAHKYMEYDLSEIDSIRENATFIFTHKHSDHFSNPILKKVLRTKKGESFGPWNINELSNCGKAISDFTIEAFKTKHLFTLKHYSYLITWHGKKLYFSGDTESADTFLKMIEIDAAFVPAWIISDLIEKDKIKESGEIAKQIIIYHIGPRDSINITGDKIRMLKTSGECFSIL